MLLSSARGSAVFSAAEGNGANSSSLETIAAKLRTPDGAFGPGTDHGQKLNKYSTRRQREAGWLPGVVFGGRARQVAISVETEVVDAARRKFGPALETLLWEMQIGGGESGTAETVMVAARQLKEHPVYSTLYSVNWLRVDPNQPLRVNIPVVYTEHDSSPAIKRGAYFNRVLRHIGCIADLSACKGGRLPTHFAISLADLEVGEILRMSDIELPDGIQFDVARGVHSERMLGSVIGKKGAMAVETIVEEAEMLL